MLMSWIITSFHDLTLGEMPGALRALIRSWWPRGSLGGDNHRPLYVPGGSSSGQGAPSTTALHHGHLVSSLVLDHFSWMDIGPRCWRLQLQPNLLLLLAGPRPASGPGSSPAVLGLSPKPITCPQLCPPGSDPKE